MEKSREVGENRFPDEGARRRVRFESVLRKNNIVAKSPQGCCQYSTVRSSPNQPLMDVHQFKRSNFKRNGTSPIPSNRDMDWYAEMWFLRSKLSLSREGGQDLSVACPRSMALCGRARGADGSRKETKTQRKPRTGLCDAWCGAPFFVTPIHIPAGREATGG
jgi:hypothetical protein